MMADGLLQQAHQYRGGFLFDGKHLLQVFLRLRQLGFLVFARFAVLRERRLQFFLGGLRVNGLLQFFRFGTGLATAEFATAALCVSIALRVIPATSTYLAS